MKNFTAVCILIFISIFMYSCDEESIESPIDESSELISIKAVTNLGGLSIYSFNEDLITEVNSNNTYQINTFSNGKMVMLEHYYDDGSIYLTDSFEYDINDRIVNNTTDYPNNETIVRNYEYIGNNILASRSEYDSDGSLIDETTYSFTLNSINQIVRYENNDGTNYWDATYTNGNLTEFVSNSGGVYKTTTLTYSTELASQPYHIESFRYGPEWKNNMMLTETSVFAFKRLADQGAGANYLTGYTFTNIYDDGSEENSIVLDVTYEFDNLGRLSKQTQTKTFYDNNPLTKELTYEYQ